MDLGRFLERKLPFYRNKLFQGFWDKVNKLSLYGLNYRAPYHKYSGEMYILKLLNYSFQNQTLCIFDVGANVGGYLSSLLSTVNRPKKVYAFEPLTAHYLELSKLELSKDIKIIQFGMSDKVEELKINYSKQIDPTASIYSHLSGNSFSEVCKFTTIDSFCEANHIEIIHFLKIDVEGHELNVLKGTSKMIEENKVLVIQFEFGLYNIESRSFFRDFYILLSPQYTIYRIVKNGLVKLEKYTVHLEKFHIANFLAVNHKVKEEFN